MRQAAHEVLLADLGKLLTAADGVLKLIDALVDFRGDTADGAGTRPPTGMSGVVEAVRAIRDVATVAVESDIRGRILIVDDNASNRDLLGRQLVRAGHTVAEAEGGRRRLRRLESEIFDLILLDMMMPDISGYEVLCRLKAKPATLDIPVIMISALDDLDSVTRCIEAGAVDYLLKPFDPTLLRARIGSSVENKLLRDREKLMVEELRREKARSENLLLSILPRSVRRPHQCRRNDDRRPRRRGQHRVRRHRGLHATGRAPDAGRTGRFLNSVFTAFDELSARFGGEKIKTIGDAYMVAFGLPDPRAGPCRGRRASGASHAGARSAGFAPVTVRRSICGSASTPGRPSQA